MGRLKDLLAAINSGVSDSSPPPAPKGRVEESQVFDMVMASSSIDVSMFSGDQSEYEDASSTEDEARVSPTPLSQEVQQAESHAVGPVFAVPAQNVGEVASTVSTIEGCNCPPAREPAICDDVPGVGGSMVAPAVDANASRGSPTPANLELVIPIIGVGGNPSTANSNPPQSSTPSLAIAGGGTSVGVEFSQPPAVPEVFAKNALANTDAVVEEPARTEVLLAALALETPTPKSIVQELPSNKGIDAHSGEVLGQSAPPLVTNFAQNSPALKEISVGAERRTQIEDNQPIATATPKRVETHTADRPNWALAPDLPEDLTKKTPVQNPKAKRQSSKAAKAKRGHRGQGSNPNQLPRAEGVSQSPRANPVATQDTTSGHGFHANSPFQNPIADTRQDWQFAQAVYDTSRADFPPSAEWSLPFRGQHNPTRSVISGPGRANSSFGMEYSWPSRGVMSPPLPEHNRTPAPYRQLDHRAGAIGSPGVESSVAHAGYSSEYTDMSLPVIINTWSRSELPRHLRYEDASPGSPISPELRGMHTRPQQGLDPRPQLRGMSSQEGYRGSNPSSMHAFTHAPPGQRNRGPGGLDGTFPAQGYRKSISHMDHSSQYVELPRNGQDLAQQPHMYARNHVTGGVSHNYQFPNGSGPSAINGGGDYQYDFARKK